MRAALFDVDGTLVDTNDLHAAAWQEAFRHFGQEISLEVIREQIGKGGDNLIPTLLGDVSDDRRESIEEFRGTLFMQRYLARAVPFPGVRDLFERLVADDVKIVLASSAGGEEVAHHLSLIGCEDLVFATTSRDDAESSKPCPDIFAAALGKIAPLGADQAVVIGDTPWDAIAAAGAGVRMIGVRSGGFSDESLTEAGAFALFDGPRDLLARYADGPFAASASSSVRAGADVDA
ncbi:HAD family hydrolase [Sphingomonas deserti]|uniref:HAD family hydrolase n=1 Tax=Allosphingosinicella deserti TaxID=2116704 RepID=A0A2P7QKW7_9SPHN|nr:HAD family hydrolase [Sphingomonas deserti]